MSMPTVLYEPHPTRPNHRPDSDLASVGRLNPALGHPPSADSVLRLQLAAGNAAVAAKLRQYRLGTDSGVHTVQRCGGEVHAGCPCATEEAEGEASDLHPPAVQRQDAASEPARASNLNSPVVQRACPPKRPAGEEASSKAGSGLLANDVTFDRKANKVVIADFPVSGASPPGGVTTEPDWERAMSIIAGTPSVGPFVGILGFSDCIGSERRNFALRQKRADAVLGMLPAASRTKVMLAQAELTGNFLAGNDTAEQRARNRAVVIRILEPIGPKLTDACDMLGAASDLDQYFFLVRCLEKRLGLTTTADAPKVLSVLRQIYYGSSSWTLPSGRTPVWDDVVTVRPWSPGTDPGPMIGKKLFGALQASQTIRDSNGKEIDLGHLLTGMDAARKPEDVSASVGPLKLGTSVKNHEWATWAGDVGSAAAMSAVCTSYLTFSPDDAGYFTGGASDQDLDGNIDAYAMWAAANDGTPDKGLRLDLKVSDALLDYYRTTKTKAGQGRANRYQIFVDFYGGAPKPGVIGKPGELHARLLPSVRDFALLYFGNEMKKVMAGKAPSYCSGTYVPPPPGRTVDFVGLLADVAIAADRMTALFVEWLKKRV